MLSVKDPSLGIAAEKHIPTETSNSKKRKGDPNGSAQRKSSKSDPALAAKEHQAIENLVAYVIDHGGSKKQVKNFRCRVTRKPSDGRYDTNYYNEQGKRFRSMAEVGRFLKLVVGKGQSPARKKASGMKKRKATTREIEAEKKKLRKELEKLTKQHTKATKSLDDFLTEQKETKYPIDDVLLLAEASTTTPIHPTNCSAARLPDIDQFPGIPKHCTQDVLLAWDFLCTFKRAISVNPISIEDFVDCLTYRPPPNLVDSDALSAPPVYLGEVHIGLLKLILSDQTSDDWWWSILETDVTENAVAKGDFGSAEDGGIPLIKIDFAALLSESEDPLMTQSWLQHLDRIRQLKSTSGKEVKACVRQAMAVTSNKWVLAYLRKAIKLAKTSGTSFMTKAILWLVDRFRAARPDLAGRTVNKEALFKQRSKILESGPCHSLQ